MKPSQIEAWTLSIADRVSTNKQLEDARVELKAEWLTDPSKVARRIAGHANASHGDLILWIIGMDEKQGVTGAGNQELSNWWAAVKAEFDGVAPEFTPLVVQYGKHELVALLFDTTRAPYVVRNPKYGKRDGGPVNWEVPWREGTSVRTATRADLIRILAPMQLLPSVEVIRGSISATETDFGNGGKLLWKAKLRLYIVPLSSQRVIVPFHHCKLTTTITGISATIEAETVLLRPPEQFVHAPVSDQRFERRRETLSLTIQATESELIIDGPGMVILEAEGRSADIEPGSCT
jgi:hypothetical protein